MFDASELRTFKQIAAEYPAFPESRLRYLYDNREHKGMSNILFKICGRRMVHRERFNAWVERAATGVES
jgi:hypothetical protein